MTGLLSGVVCKHGQLARSCLVCELTQERDEARAEAAIWQESCGENYVRAQDAEMEVERLTRERDEARAEVERLRGAIELAALEVLGDE